MGRTLLLLPLSLVCVGLLAPQARLQEPEPFPVGDPAALGVDPARLQALVARVEQWVDDGDIVGGELLVVVRRQTVLHETRGWLDRERELPMRARTICRIRSMTKPFVGTAVQLLVEDGRLALDDAVADHLPSFDHDAAAAITVRQLLHHEGGFTQPGYPADVTGYANLAAAVDAVGAAGPKHEPGTAFVYSDAGSATLGALVAAVSGKSCEEFIHARILTPLGLDDTLCNLAMDDPRRPRVASTYIRRGAEFNKYWDREQPQQMPFFRASGGMYSTTVDYARFLTAWIDASASASAVESADAPPTLLGRSAARAALQPSAHTRDRAFGYGQHWQVFRARPGAPFRTGEQRPLFGHGGSDGTFAIADPERDWIACYFTQSRGNRTIPEMTRMLCALFE